MNSWPEYVSFVLVCIVLNYGQVHSQNIDIEIHWGRNGINQLDTKAGTLQVDMYQDSILIVTFDLTAREKSEILDSAYAVGFFSFPQDIRDSLTRTDTLTEDEALLTKNVVDKPCMSSYVRIATSTGSHWVDYDTCVPNRPGWVEGLERLHERILAIIREKREFKSLPIPGNLMHDLRAH